MSLSVDKKREGWRKASKKYAGKNKDKIEKKRKSLGKKYFADATRKYAHKNKDKIKEKAKRVYHKDKTKALVRAKTNYSNEKTGTCSDCGKQTKTEFHHKYYKPNLFLELCRRCHNKRHGRETWVA